MLVRQFQALKRLSYMPICLYLSVKVDANSFSGSYGVLTLANMIFFSHMQCRQEAV